MTGAMWAAGLVLFWAASPLAGTPAQEERARQAQAPIRVGGNVQESKLIHKVAPLYPEAAKAARISGIVILQVTVDEEGMVSDVKVLRGHPLLNDPTVAAVRQWRYSPTLLNGQPVPAIATVTVAFGAAAVRNVEVDDFGNLRDPDKDLEGAALLEDIRESGESVAVTPSAKIPFRVLERILQGLEREGLTGLQVKGGYAFRESRLYYTIGSEASGTHLTPPELALDKDRLSGIAGASGPRPEAGREADGILLYQLFMNEIGEIVSLRQMRGPQVPEVEAELRRTRVVSPGRIGAEPVPVAFYLEIAIR